MSEKVNRENISFVLNSYFNNLAFISPELKQKTKPMISSIKRKIVKC